MAVLKFEFGVSGGGGGGGVCFCFFENSNLIFWCLLSDFNVFFDVFILIEGNILRAEHLIEKVMNIIKYFNKNILFKKYNIYEYSKIFLKKKKSIKDLKRKFKIKLLYSEENENKKIENNNNDEESKFINSLDKNINNFNEDENNNFKFVKKKKKKKLNLNNNNELIKLNNNNDLNNNNINNDIVFDKETDFLDLLETDEEIKKKKEKDSFFHLLSTNPNDIRLRKIFYEHKLGGLDLPSPHYIVEFPSTTLIEKARQLYSPKNVKFYKSVTKYEDLPDKFIPESIFLKFNIIVGIAGRSNVGKSSLINKTFGSKIAETSSKPVNFINKLIKIILI
jgi:hypothetical protein